MINICKDMPSTLELSCHDLLFIHNFVAGSSFDQIVLERLLCETKGFCDE